MSTKQQNFPNCQLNKFRACQTIGLSRGKSSRPILIYYEELFLIGAVNPLFLVL
jgi:hypothetical protein